MRLSERYRRLLLYDDWANREVLNSLKAQQDSSSPHAERSLKLLGHVVASEWLWLRRLGAPSGQLAVWPGLKVDECETQIDLLRVAWERYLEASSDDLFAESITYVNSKGKQWSSRVEDVLMHVVMHSAYHRGQIAAETRAAGVTPAYTDFIQAVRSGAVV